MTVWRRCGGQDTEVEDKRVLSCSVFISVNRCYSRGMRTLLFSVFECLLLMVVMADRDHYRAGRQREVSSLIQFGLLLCLLFPLQAHTLMCFQCITSHQWQIGNCVWRVCTEEKEPDLLLLFLLLFMFFLFLSFFTIRVVNNISVFLVVAVVV